MPGQERIAHAGVLIAFNSAKRFGSASAEVEFVFGGLLLLEVGILAGHVGDPRAPVGFDFQRADGRLVVFDEFLGLGVGPLVFSGAAVA